MQKSFFHKVAGIIEKNENAALCIITGTKGSTPLKTGAKMIVWEDGKIYGTVGGGAFENKVIVDALEVMNTGAGKIFEHHLTRDHNMCCGGTVTVYIEPVVLPWNLYIFGAGHVGRELAFLGNHLDFDVTVIDDRKDIFGTWPSGEIRLRNENPVGVIPTLAWNNRTFAVILTYSHPLDRKILEACLSKEWGYLGMIGSRRKVEVTKRMFLEKDISEPEILSKVDMPVGLNINAHTPQEIAVSIIARLIMEKNKPKKTEHMEDKTMISQEEIKELLAGIPKCS
ncbi:MAG: XdhC family protein [Bacteroidetes bacterium]|nr:XdhC family protein [Bacteroidota bacterium]